MKNLIWTIPLALCIACGDKDEDTGDTSDTSVDSAEDTGSSEGEE